MLGYWGPHIGFYGGVDYGFGYDGIGYEGGYWKDGSFFYNSAVNNLTNVAVTNVYSKPVAIDRTRNASFNGGMDGTTAKATPEQLAAQWEHHIAATPEQTRHAEAASKDPALSLSRNHGHPAVAATATRRAIQRSWSCGRPDWTSQQKRRPRTPQRSATQSPFRPKWRTTDFLHHRGRPWRQQVPVRMKISRCLGRSLLERQNVKLIAKRHNTPHRRRSQPTTQPQTAKLVAQPLRPATDGDQTMTSDKVPMSAWSADC